jgi:hypothetical protein
LEKKWKHDETVHQIFIELKNAYDSVRRVVLYNILIEFGVPLKTVHTGNQLSDSFLSRIIYKREMLNNHCFSTLLSKMPLGRSRKTR